MGTGSVLCQVIVKSIRTFWLKFEHVYSFAGHKDLMNR